MKVRHLLAHTGGTGDIFGPEFDAHEVNFNELSDRLTAYRSQEERARMDLPQWRPHAGECASAPTPPLSGESRCALEAGKS